MNAVVLMSEQKRTRILNRTVFILMLAICGGNFPAPAQTTSTALRPAGASQDGAMRPPGAAQPSPATGIQGAVSDVTAPPGIAARSASQNSPLALEKADATSATSATPVNATVSDDAIQISKAAKPIGDEDSNTISLSSLLKPRPVPPMPSLVRLGVRTDQVVALTLEGAVRLALENNNDIELARGDVRLTESNLLSFEAVYDPVLVFNSALSNRVTPIASALGGSDRTGTVTTNGLNFDATIIKPFRTGGGQYQFFFNNTRESTSSSFSQLNPFYSSNSGVQFTQPLMRDRAFDFNRRAIHVQRKRLQQSDADFRRITTGTIADVGRAYWDLVFALRDQQNRKGNLQLARELFKQTEQRIEAGSSAPFQRAEIETELATRESELIASTQNVSAAEVALKLLILRNPLAPEWSAALVPVDTPSFESAPVNLEDAIREARTNRPELSRLTTEAEISDIDLQYFKNQMRPRVDIQVTVSTTGLAGSPVIPTGTITGGGALPENLTGGYGQTLRNLIGLETRNVVVGVRIEVPFRNRRAQADFASARIGRSQLDALRAKQEQVVEAEVRLTAQAVETARQRVLVARGARLSAELQLEGERRLYELGRSTTFLLFQRENGLTNVRNLELRAETDYNKALASLQLATATTLKTYRIALELSAGR